MRSPPDPPPRWHAIEQAMREEAARLQTEIEQTIAAEREGALRRSLQADRLAREAFERATSEDYRPIVLPSEGVQVEPVHVAEGVDPVRHVEVERAAVPYFDRQGHPLTAEAWSQLWSDPAYKVLRQEEVDETVVSTAWLGINHNWSGEGPPLIFETMAFIDGRARGDIDVRRYATERQALTGHAEVVAEVRASEPPSEDDDEDDWRPVPRWPDGTPYVSGDYDTDRANDPESDEPPWEPMHAGDRRAWYAIVRAVRFALAIAPSAAVRFAGTLLVAVGIAQVLDGYDPFSPLALTIFAVMAVLGAALQKRHRWRRSEPGGQYYPGAPSAEVYEAPDIGTEWELK